MRRFPRRTFSEESAVTGAVEVPEIPGPPSDENGNFVVGPAAVASNTTTTTTTTATRAAAAG